MGVYTFGYCTSHIARELVDDAIASLGDPGVVADVHRLRAYTNQLEHVKKQRLFFGALPSSISFHDDL
jgi:hypothetical protein